MFLIAILGLGQLEADSSQTQRQVCRRCVASARSQNTASMHSKRNLAHTNRFATYVQKRVLRYNLSIRTFVSEPSLQIYQIQ